MREIKNKIIEWAKANYEKSYAAQTVIECWDDEDFAEYKSLAEFKKNYVAFTDDRYADIRATVF